MGILDDLKKEADNTRLAREQAELRQKELDTIYRNKIGPAMLKIHGYLLELVEQLSLVDWSVDVSFDFPGIGKVDNLAQTNYRITIDSRTEPKLIGLQFECAAREEKNYTVTPKSAGDEACQFLLSQKVLFSDWAVRDTNQEVVGMVIKCKLRMWVGMAFKADIENKGIRVSSYNFEGQGEKSFLVNYQSIDDQWLDKLGQYILRKNDNFGKLDISDIQLEKLRILVQEEKLRRENLTVEARQPTNAQDSLLLRLGKLFNKP